MTDSAFQHRNLFLTRDGKAKYLTIPFNRKGYLRRPLRDLEITDPGWSTGHLNFITNNYGRHPFYRQIFPVVEPLFRKRYDRLLDPIMESMRLSMECFGIDARIIFQSSLDYDRAARKGDLVMELLRANGARCYLSGAGAKSYLDESKFGTDIKLLYDDFEHPVYPQINTERFAVGLSCLDVLFNIGRDEASKLFSGSAAK